MTRLRCILSTDCFESVGPGWGLTAKGRLVVGDFFRLRDWLEETSPVDPTSEAFGTEADEIAIEIDANIAGRVKQLLNQRNRLIGALETALDAVEGGAASRSAIIETVRADLERVRKEVAK